MKPLYVVLIAVVLVIGIVLVYQYNKKKQADAKSATAAALSSGYPSGILTNGGSSQVAQIIGSLFPYFQTAASTGIIGDGKKTTETKPVTSDVLPQKTITLV